MSPIQLSRLMKNWRDNVSFILVEPSEPGNIGASARALKNMGFSGLCLVNPLTAITEEARYFAHNAIDVLDSARTFGSLREAVADKSLIVGTTRRRGGHRGVFMLFEEGLKRAAQSAMRGRVAVLFGREQRGLLTSETRECAFLLSIPSGTRQPSLNLAQAVVVTAYELARAGRSNQATTRACGPKIPAVLTHEEMDRIYGRVSGVLDLMGYREGGGKDIKGRIMLMIKRLVDRSGLTPKEANMLQGLCARLEKMLGVE